MHLLLRSSMRLDGRGVGNGRDLRNHTERVYVLHSGSRATAYLGVTPGQFPSSKQETNHSHLECVLQNNF